MNEKNGTSLLSNTVKICEIFASIQGESTFAGLPCVFVRLSGCNLRCGYCDTVYAYEEGEIMTCEDVILSVRSYGVALAEITGGEPLLQEGSLALVTRLVDEGFRVLVETNGSMSIASLDPRAVVIMDVKCPSSGMSGTTDLSNIPRLRATDEVKFVLSGREDYEWAKTFMTAHALQDKCTVLFSPVYGVLSPAQLAGWIVSDRITVRLNLQLHKYMFGPDARGV